MQRRRQAGVGSGAGALLLGHDDPLAAGGSSAGSDCQHDAPVLDVVRGQLGDGAAGGGDLFSGEPRCVRPRGRRAAARRRGGWPPASWCRASGVAHQRGLWRRRERARRVLPARHALRNCSVALRGGIADGRGRRARGELAPAVKALPSGERPLGVELAPHPPTEISTSTSASDAAAFGRVIGRVGVGRRRSCRRRGWRAVPRASVVRCRRGSAGRRSRRCRARCRRRRSRRGRCWRRR